jgi:plastocyanin
MRGISITLGFFVAGSIAGCSSGDNIDQPSGRNPAANAISIVVGAQTKASGAFSPNPLTISLATNTLGLVDWWNDDHTSYGNNAVIHNITADDRSFTSGEMAPGNQFEASYGAPGTYSYHCSIHPTMKGTVIVTP